MLNAAFGVVRSALSISPLFLRRFLLTGHCSALAFPGTAVGTCTLATNRQSFTVTNTTVTGDIQQTLDALYGGLYYRLLTGVGPLSNSYMEGIFTHVMKGVRAEPPKAIP